MLRQLLESTAYREVEPPSRIRDPSKPMQVICPGFPRSATESLQIALLKLGYNHTYHVRLDTNGGAAINAVALRDLRELLLTIPGMGHSLRRPSPHARLVSAGLQEVRRCR